LPRDKVMVIATGGQGEPRAALARMAADGHQIKLQAGDTVVFSSKQIPGNEVAIGRIMNQLAAKDVLTVTEKQAHIHVSGHPGQPELAALYGWLRPKLVAAGARRNPPHARAGALRARTGVPDALVQENGDLVRLVARAPRDHRARSRRSVDPRRRRHPARRWRDDQRAAQAVRSTAISPSRRFSPASVSSESAISYRGVPVEDEREAFIDEMREAAEQAATAPARDQEKLREAIRLGVRRDRDRLDGEETRRRRHARRDLNGAATMKWTSALAIYLLFWAFSAFFVLPFHGRRASDDATPLVKGQDHGAPANFRPGASCCR
jgi:ribonuclease J